MLSGGEGVKKAAPVVHRTDVKVAKNPDMPEGDASQYRPIHIQDHFRSEEDDIGCYWKYPTIGASSLFKDFKIDHPVPKK